ncbi:MAG: response regulator [Bernardetiaceae bacterium]
MKNVILCVDDEAIVLDSLRLQLQSQLGEGFTCECAESAEEGLELIEEIIEEGDRVVVVISDWLMPKMKGDEFLIQLHQRHPEIAKIILSGQSDKAAIQGLYNKANLRGFVSKPWQYQELLQMVKTAIGTSNR